MLIITRGVESMNEDLPIFEIIPDIKNKLLQNNTVILQAPPGAGKSTVLPLQLLHEPWMKGKKILLLEPRRLAARSVAFRLSTSINEEPGVTVGYRIRFENKISKETRIEVLTEGILTRMIQNDNSLENIGMVIFDEFHERSLHADLALALCREVQQVLREDLRILVMSATLDGEKISSILGNAPILTSKGRQYPVEIIYYPQDKDLPIAIQVSKAIRKAYQEQEGDILAFLPGTGEIHKAQEILKEEISGVNVCPLYGDLSQEKQQRAIQPDVYGKRKVVLATSIAETSLTIEGITTVIDSGYARGPRFDPRTGLTRLDTYKVTKDAADQRAGRAGRLGPGCCYRLWSEGTHQHLTPHRVPEILEADLAPTVLELTQWGAEINSLTWITTPPVGAVSQAKKLLHDLHALSEDKITDKGKEMLRLPTHPRIAHLLLEGKEASMLSLAIDIASILEERDPLSKEAGANISLRVNELRKWRRKEYSHAERNTLERIERLVDSWKKNFRVEKDSQPIKQEDAGKLIAAAFPERIGRKRNHEQRFRLASGRVASLKEHDPLIIEEWLAIAHMDAGSNDGKIYLAAPLDVNEIRHLAEEKESVMWDSQKGILIAQKEQRIGEIILSSTPIVKIDEDQKIKILCKVVQDQGESLLPWSEDTDQWMARIMSLKKWRPEEEWPEVSKKRLLNTADEWLAPYLLNVRKREDFQKLDLQTILKSTLPWELASKADTLAPASIKVPSGSNIKLQYNEEGNPPVLAVRLQEVFGLSDTPTINEGRNSILLHLLSPGYRPVQVTQDLKSFWNNTYQEVRKELRVRYQKHHWPEDPWTAEAVRGAKRRT